MLYWSRTFLVRRVASATPSRLFVRCVSEKLLYGDELVRIPTGRSKPYTNERHSTATKTRSVPEVLSFDTEKKTSRQTTFTEHLFEELEGHDPRLCDAIEAARGRQAQKSPASPRTVVLEGKQLIIDALSSGGHVQSLYFSSRDALQGLSSRKRIENIYYVPHRLLKQFSSLKTCPGLLAIFEVPDPTVLTTRYPSHGVWRPLPITLVLNGIRDPGNMGSLLRTAASFGLSSVLVSEGSVDIWNEKVIRAGMSSHFRVPVYQNLSWREIGDRISDEAIRMLGAGDIDHVKVFVADVASEATEKRIAECSKFENLAIPVINSDVNLNDTNNDSFVTTFPTSFQSFVSSPHVATAYRLPLPSAPHFRIDFFSEESTLSEISKCEPSSERLSFKPVLVIGSETEGLSPEAYYLAHLTGGSRVVIPSSPDTDSLNVLSAASVILGEMQRQYLSR